MNVVDVLRASPGRVDARALAGEGISLSYQELNERVDQRAAALGAVAAGSVAPVLIEPDVNGIVELLAHWRRGLLPAPINPALGRRERAAAVAVLESAAPPVGTQTILWTSGTAGRPRGVALSWQNLVESANGARERLGLTPDDVWLASLSPAHVGGLALIIRSLVLGGTLVAEGRFEVGRVSDVLDRDLGPTHVSLVPTQLMRFLDHRGDRRAPLRLKCALLGGAHAPSSLVDRALDLGWPLALTYGATEMSSQIATAPPELVRERTGTVGLPLAGVEIVVDDGGELLARGPTRALGYVGTDAPLASEGGWYRTGDLGRVDAAGNLWITGRRLDRIVSGGVTIDAVEVEEALRSHPSVLDVCVVGVPDDDWGERVGAWIEPVVGEFDVEEVEVFLRDRLSGPKLPRVWYAEGVLPRNVNGKVDRAAVRESLRRRYASE